MSEARKVYLAASGSYSDYQVHCAFTTHELALAYVAHRNNVPIDIQRRHEELTDKWKNTATHMKALRDLSDAHEGLDAIDAFYVQERELWDELPINDGPAA